MENPDMWSWPVQSKPQDVQIKVSVTTDAKITIETTAADGTQNSLVMNLDGANAFMNSLAKAIDMAEVALDDDD